MANHIIIAPSVSTARDLNVRAGGVGVPFHSNFVCR